MVMTIEPHLAPQRCRHPPHVDHRGFAALGHDSLSAFASGAADSHPLCAPVELPCSRNTRDSSRSSRTRVGLCTTAPWPHQAGAFEYYPWRAAVEALLDGTTLPWIGGCTNLNDQGRGALLLHRPLDGCAASLPSSTFKICYPKAQFLRFFQYLGKLAKIRGGTYLIKLHNPPTNSTTGGRDFRESSEAGCSGKLLETRGVGDGLTLGLI